MTHFKKISEKDIEELVPFAEKIWKEHYYACFEYCDQKESYVIL